MNDFFAELKRRRMYRVGAGYVVVAWAITQVIDVLSQVFNLSAWIGQTTIVMLVVGLPLVLIAQWLLDGRALAADPSAANSRRAIVDWLLFSSVAIIACLTVFWLMIPNNAVVVADSEDGRVAIAALPNSLAILPLENLSPDPENAYFAAGIHHDLLSHLAKISALKVISRTSVIGYRETTKNMREIGQELAVANVLEGGVRRAGNMLQINVDLIDAQTDETLWAETYNREMNAQNTFAIQNEIAFAIANALQATLLPQEVASLNAVPTLNTLAYDYYLEGNEFLYSGNYLTDIPRAVELYALAVEDDPDFALAWAALSRSHSMAYWFYVDRTEMRLAMALEAVQRALEIAPDLPEAHLAMGDYFYQGRRDYARALAEYSTADQGTSGDSTVLEQRAYIFRRIGEWDLAIALLSEAAERDPRNVALIIERGSTQLALRNYALADQHFAHAIEIDLENVNAYVWRSFIPLYRDGDVAAHRAVLRSAPVPLVDAVSFLVWVAAIYERDYEEAISALNRWDLDAEANPLEFAERNSLYGVTNRLAGRRVEAEASFEAAHAQLQNLVQSGLTDPALYIALGEVLAGLGERDEAIAAGLRAIELLPTSEDALGGPQYQLDAIVRVFIPAGDYGLAINELDKYLSTRGSMWSMAGLLPDPRLEPILDDPRFVALVEKYTTR